MTKRKVRVVIANVPYYIVTDERDEHIQQASQSVEELILNLQGALPEVQRAAVLAALQLSSRVLQLEKRLEEREQEIFDHDKKYADLIGKLDSF